MGKDIKRKSGTTVCFLRGNTRAQVHSRTPICLLPKALEGEYPLRCGGKGVAPQPAKPERLIRALRSKTFQLTSATSPAIALGPPSWPPPPGPPVSSSRPAPPPRATLSGGAPAGSEREGELQPSFAASRASVGQPYGRVRRCLDAVVRASGLRSFSLGRRHGAFRLPSSAAVGRRAGAEGLPWRRQAGCWAPGCCWRRCLGASRCWESGRSRRGHCTTSRPSSLGPRPGAPWRPSETSTLTSRRTSSCCGKVSACPALPLFACPSQCSPHPLPGFSVLLHFPALLSQPSPPLFPASLQLAFFPPSFPNPGPGLTTPPFDPPPQALETPRFFGFFS